MNKAAGVELVGRRMLTELAHEISYTVAELCVGDVPQHWKLANVTPIVKVKSSQVSDVDRRRLGKSSESVQYSALC